MGKFKNWCSKQAKKLLLSSELELDDEQEDETYLPENLQLNAYILMGSDTQGEDFVSVNFAEGQQQKMIELLFLFHSGLLVEQCIESLKELCDTEAEAVLILQSVAVLLQKHQQLQTPPSNPVVDPCDVFKQADKHDFKG